MANEDGKTGLGEAIVVAVLLFVSVLLFTNPSAADVGTVVDIVDALPEPAEMGSYGSGAAAAVVALSGGALVKNWRSK